MIYVYQGLERLLDSKSVTEVRLYPVPSKVGSAQNNKKALVQALG